MGRMAMTGGGMTAARPGSRQMIASWLCLAGIWAGASSAVSGFVRPWVSLRVKSDAVGEAVGRVSQDAQVRALAEELSKRVGRIAIQVRRGERMVGGELPDLTTLPRQMSGYDIPRLLHRSDMQGLLALAELLMKQRDIARKSYAVYCLPGLALAVAILLTVAARGRGLAPPPAASADPTTYLLASGEPRSGGSLEANPDRWWGEGGSAPTAPALRAAAGGGVAVCLGLACLAVAGTLWWKLMTLRAETPLLRLVVEGGLWQTCGAYVILGLSAIGCAMAMPRRRPQQA